MLWFALWATLAVGAVAVLVLVLRSVYLKGRRLLEELSRAADVTAELATKVEELSAALEAVEAARQQERAQHRTTDDPFGAEAAHDRRADRAVRRERAHTERLARNARTVERWRQITGGS